MPLYKVLGAKVITYKKWYFLDCDTEEIAREWAEEKLAEFSPTLDDPKKIHTQVYFVQQKGE